MPGFSPDRKRSHLALRHPRSFVVGLVASVAVIALAAGCGSNDGKTASVASSGGTSAASTQASPAGTDLSAIQAIVDKARQPSNTFVAPGPPVNAKSVRGKTIWFIPLAATVPAFAQEQRGLADAAKALGVTLKVCDAKFTPAGASACMNQAANSGASGIFVDAVAPNLTAPALRAVAVKKVPVVEIYAKRVVPATKLLQYVDMRDIDTHRVVASWIIAHSKGKATILTSSVAGDPAATHGAVSGGFAEIKQKCPDCKMYNITSTPTTVDGLTASASSAALRHTDITYGFPQYDFLFPPFVRGLQQSAKARGITLVSSDFDVAALKRVKGGQEAATAAQNRNYGGWLAMDQWLRMVLGKAPAKDVPLPVRLFDKQNIASAELTDTALLTGSLYGPTTYTQSFLKLWGA